MRLYFHHSRVFREMRSARMRKLHYELLSKVWKFKGFDRLSEMDKISHPPIYEAMRLEMGLSKNLRMAKFLVENRIDLLWMEPEKGVTPAALAFSSRNSDLIDAIIDNLDNVDEILDKDGNTALFLAIKHGDDYATLKLLKKGANPNHKDKSGSTMLHEIVERNSSAMLELLLYFGAELDNVATVDYRVPSYSSSSRGATYGSPLHLAVKLDLTILKTMLRYRPSMTVTDSQGSTALELALEHDTSQKDMLLAYVFTTNLHPESLVKRRNKLKLRGRATHFQKKCKRELWQLKNFELSHHPSLYYHDLLISSVSTNANWLKIRNVRDSLIKDQKEIHDEHPVFRDLLEDKIKAAMSLRVARKKLLKYLDNGQVKLPYDVMDLIVSMMDVREVMRLVTIIEDDECSSL